MWSWIPAVIAALFAVIKGLFGTDKPAKETHVETPSPMPPPDTADILRDLGITSDANGATGGAFPTVPAAPDGMHDRADHRNTAHLHSPWPTAAGDDERDSDR